MAPSSFKPAFVSSIAIPALVFVLLSALASLVWIEQRAYEHSLIERHTEDICVQAARRTEIFMASHLRTAEIFARRWVSRPDEDFSKERFTSFAGVVLQESPGLEHVLLIAPDGQAVWQVPASGDPISAEQRRRLGDFQRDLSRGVRALVSEPYEGEDGGEHIALTLALEKEGQARGTMVFDMHTMTLIDSCFHQKIRSEFNFVIRDAQQEIFRSDPQAALATLEAVRPNCRRSFPVVNQTWELVMSPRPEVLEQRSALSDLAVPLFGYLASLGLALLVWLLQRRMRLLELARRQHTQLSRKVLVAQEEERARLSRELHDELGQVLTALRLEVGWLFEGQERSPEEMNSIAASTVSLVDGATSQLRRICRGLHPPMLHDLGLEPVARQLIDEFIAVSKLEVTSHLELDEAQDTLSEDAALCAYRILQEALNNILKHARATRVEVALFRRGDALFLEVTDDGQGFDGNTLVSTDSCGIDGMIERAALVGGAVEVVATPGGGCRVKLSVPAAGGRAREESV